MAVPTAEGKVMVAWDWRDGELKKRWVFDSKDGKNEFSGMGGHSLAVADVDADGKDGIVYQAMVVDDDGKGLFSTGRRHGDTLRVGDLDPDREGMELDLAADLIGDWQEELLLLGLEGKSLRLYTTPIPSEHGVRCLMLDRQYRLAVALQNVVYNKASQVGFYLGNEMESER